MILGTTCTGSTFERMRIGSEFQYHNVRITSCGTYPAQIGDTLKKEILQTHIQKIPHNHSRQSKIGVNNPFCKGNDLLELLPRNHNIMKEEQQIKI
jgi:hypothetical protein